MRHLLSLSLLAVLLPSGLLFAGEVSVRVIPQSADLPGKVQYAVPGGEIFMTLSADRGWIKMPDSVTGSGGVNYRYIVVNAEQSVRQWTNAKVKQDEQGYYLHIVAAPKE